MPKTYDVVPNPRRGGWDVRASSGRLVSRHQACNDAINAATRYVRNAGGGSVRVHNPGGGVLTADVPDRAAHAATSS
jgi:hypothetical protein